MTKKHWRIGLIVLVIGLLAFGGAMVGLADYPDEPDKPEDSDCPTPDPVLPDVDWFSSPTNYPSLGAGDPKPDQLPLLDECEDYGYLKVNYGDSVGGDGKPALEDGWYYADMGDDEVTGTVDGFKVYIWNNGDGTFTWKSDNYPVTYVYAKGGPDGGNMYIYDPPSICGTNLAQPGGGAFSHINFYYCVGQEDLDVSKTVFNSYIRTHDWSIEKRVETDEEDVYEGYPKIWLDGPSDYTEMATWYVDVTYEGYEDSDFLVYGEITIENTGDLPAVIVDVVDELCGDEIDVVWPDGFEAGDTLAVDQTIVLTYSVNVDAILEDCDNVVTVTTERDSYFDEVAVPAWGDPAEDHHAEVDVVDDSEFLDVSLLGTLDAYDYEAGNVIPFEYDEEFAWVDYQDNCGQGFTYVNTAEVIGDDDEVLDSASATLKVNIRCEDLDVSKTVVTYFEREHFWDIDKSVETENEEFVNGTPKVWLYIDGSGDETATWTVDVTYEGYEDSGFNVSGVITIVNTGDLPAVITSIGDVLGGTAITTSCVEFPYTLAVGETLTCTYDEDGSFEGDNVVTVTTERDTYGATEPIVWGEPDEEINATVNIKDISDLFGEVDLGTVTAPNDAQFTYTKDFAWADYGADDCGSFQYDNIATIVETEQSADATLKVNVQCFKYDTAYAKGDNAICFIPTFSQWGWTNPIEPGSSYTWDLWAGAAQCDTDNGTLVGTVTVVYDAAGYVNVTFNVDAPYTLEEYHVYAGYDMFPQVERGRRTEDTVAPGQYYNDSPFDGSEVYVIAHGVVGYPDPDFGPAE